MRGLHRQPVVGELDQTAPIDFEEVHDTAKSPRDLVVYLEGRQPAEHGGQLGQEGFEAQPLVECELGSPPLQGAGKDLTEELDARQQLVRPGPLDANRIEGQDA